MSYEMTGKIKQIEDTQTFSTGTTKREFVITTGGEYSQDLKFGAWKDKAAPLDDLKPGDEVTVKFDIRGNEYKDRHYVDLSAYSIKPGARAEGASKAREAMQDQGEPEKSEVTCSENFPF